MTAPTDDRLTEAVPPERLAAARAAYHDARLAGLCHDGAWEVALGTDDPPRPADETHEPTT